MIETIHFILNFLSKEATLKNRNKVGLQNQYFPQSVSLL